MKLIKAIVLLGTLLFADLAAATISGHVYCDVNDNGVRDPGEICTSEAAWVKLITPSGKVIAQAPTLPGGEYSFNVNVTGNFTVFIDNNSDKRDTTPTPPANMLFGNPASGSILVPIASPDDVITDQDMGLIFNYACDCAGGDGNMTMDPIVIDGIMSDWTNIALDPDNGSCDAGCRDDYDINKTQIGLIQSTGRNLVQFSWTGEQNPNGFVYGYTVRVGSSTNTETFLFYKDGDADGLMETGDIALTAEWRGNTGTVVMNICDYVPADPINGDPMVWQPSDVGTPLLYPGGTTVPEEWVGKADGYTLAGGLINCREEPGLVGQGSADGVQMEWQVPWTLVNMTPFQPITYHISTMNSAVNDNNPPGQIDDNMGNCFSANLAVNKTVNDPNPRVGDTITYTVNVTNFGIAAPFSVVANDLLPTGVTYVSHSGTDWTCNYQNQELNCTYGPVLSGTTSFQINATVDAGYEGQTLTNTVCVSADENTTQVCDDENITVYTPMVLLDIVKTTSTPTPFEGGLAVFAITVTNNGPDIANGISLRDELPDGNLTYFDSNGTDWNCSTADNYTLYCDYNQPLGVGASTTLYMGATVEPGTAGVTQTNTAYVNADENATEVSDTADVTPQLPPPSGVVFSVVKDVNNPTPVIGEFIQYSIIVTNNGPEDATNVEVNDTLPPEVTYFSSLATAGTYNSATGIWSVGDLTVGSGALLTIVAEVDTDAIVGTEFQNEACAVADQNSTPTCDDANATPRAPVVTMQIDKVVNNANPKTGDSITYTITVTNNGTDTANNVSVDDTPPVTGLTNLVASGTNWTCVGLDCTYDLPLAPSASASYQITADVTGPAGDEISNLACVVADENTTAGVCDDANLTVYTPQVSMRTTKIVDVAQPNEGDTIHYTISVTNVGMDPATDINVTDTLPAGVTFDSVTPNGWTCVGTGPVTCTYPLLNPGQSAGFGITATVNTGTAGTTQQNTACTIVDENSSRICDDANITVRNDTDIGVLKVVDNAMPAEGDTIVYTITVTNYGPIDGTGILVDEDLAALPGLSCTPQVPSQGSFANPTWDVGTLTVGSSAEMNVSCLVNPDTAGTTYTNNAAVVGLDQNDTNPANDLDQATINIVLPVPTLSEWGRILLFGLMMLFGLKLLARSRAR